MDITHTLWVCVRVSSMGRIDLFFKLVVIDEEYLKSCQRSASYNVYCRRNWNPQPVCKYWMRLFDFHFVLMPLGKAWIYLFYSQQWVNCRRDSHLISLRQPIEENLNQLYSALKWTLCHSLSDPEGLSKCRQETIQQCANYLYWIGILDTI